MYNRLCDPVFVITVLSMTAVVCWVIRRGQANNFFLWTPCECRHLGTPEERKNAVLRGLKAFYWRWQTWTLLVICVPAMGTIAAHVMASIPSYCRNSSHARLMEKICHFSAEPIALLCLGVIYIQMKRFLRVFLRKHFASLGFPICAHCGYDLRKNASGSCPECGRSFDAGAASAESEAGT